MNKAYLLLGSNIGNRADYIEKALESLEAMHVRVSQCSGIYESEAWGEACEGQDPYLNVAAEVATELAPKELLSAVLEVEKKLGRIRRKKWEAREIDIDILSMNELQSNDPDLVLPHPFLAQRRFALTPLAEIDADHQIPGTGKSVRKLLEICPDQAAVKLFSAPPVINRK